MSNSNQSIQTKFRPSLTLDEINTIVFLLNANGEAKLAKKLNTFILKAQIGITAPSHVTIPKQSLEDSLGFGSETISTNQTIEQLYTIWQTSPASLSQSQLAQVSHYRYINDLMSPEEESKHEAGQ